MTISPAEIIDTFQVDRNPFPDMEALTGNDGRYYKTPDGKWLPSVTTVINPDGLPDVPAIRNAAERGTGVHALLQSLLFPTSVDDLHDVHAGTSRAELQIRLSMASVAVQSVARHFDRLYAVEQAIAGDGYAGRIDLVGQDRSGMVVIMDLKTSSRSFEPKLTDPRTRKAFMQQYAYALAWNRAAAEAVVAVPLVRGASILNVNPDSRQGYILTMPLAELDLVGIGTDFESALRNFIPREPE